MCDIQQPPPNNLTTYLPITSNSTAPTTLHFIEKGSDPRTDLNRGAMGILAVYQVISADVVVVAVAFRRHCLRSYVLRNPTHSKKKKKKRREEKGDGSGYLLCAASVRLLTTNTNKSNSNTTAHPSQSRESSSPPPPPPT
jgi:hypothetical protein